MAIVTSVYSWWAQRAKTAKLIILVGELIIGW
jgi:hypothetical protein